METVCPFENPQIFKIRSYVTVPSHNKSHCKQGKQHYLAILFFCSYCHYFNDEILSRVAEIT